MESLGRASLVRSYFGHRQIKVPYCFAAIGIDGNPMGVVGAASRSTEGSTNSLLGRTEVFSTCRFEVLRRGLMAWWQECSGEAGERVG